MDAATRLLVRRRASDRCEYCGLPQAASFHAFHVEHVTAKQHRGGDEPENLALACNRCNSHKGPNLTSIDPESGQLVELFSPRRETWADHFELRDGEVLGVTAIGRATALLLEMNDPERVALRLLWSQQSDDAPDTAS